MPMDNEWRDKALVMMICGEDVIFVNHGNLDLMNS